MDLVVSICFVVVAIVISIFGAKLLAKYNVQKEELEAVKIMFNLTTQIVDELNLKHEEKILLISNVVDHGITFALLLYNIEEKEELKKAAKDYCLKNLEQLNIDVDENRLAIIDGLLEIGIKSI